MKKSILLALIVSLILISFNMFAADGDLIVNGNVGIGTGTTPPAQKLDVQGNAVVSGNVGIGTTTPAQKLSVAGTIESTSGGVKFPDGTTQTSASKVVQIADYRRSDYLTGSGQLPGDDTIPQITEGDEILYLAITPKNTANILKIDAVLSISCSTPAGAAGGINVALFKVGQTDALSAVCPQVTGSTSPQISSIPLTFYTTAGTTSPITFKVRVGSGTGGSWSINGVYGNGRRFGGTMYSSITVTEIAP